MDGLLSCSMFLGEAAKVFVLKRESEPLEFFY